MKRAVLAVLLAACRAGAGDRPVTDGGGSMDGGDAGASIQGRVCIVKDLRHPTDCDTTQDASRLTVLLGTRTATAPPTPAGDFEVAAQLGTGLVWHVSGATVVTSAMPFGTDHTIPVVPDDVYNELLGSNQVTIPAEGQGSVVVRVVSGAVPAAGVSATSTLVSGNVVPRYDADSSALDWREVGPTQTAGVLWFPGVEVTASPARIALTPPVGARVDVTVSVEEQAITFVTQDVR